MDSAVLASLLFIALPFWLTAGWLLLRQRQAAAERRRRLLRRIGLEDGATGESGTKRRESFAQNLELRLQQAGLAGRGNRVKQWMLAGAGVVGLLGVVMATLFGAKVALLSAAAVAFAPLYIFYQIMTRRRHFAEQFPDALEAMVRSLQAGMSMDAAMRSVAEDFSAPLADEFRRMNRQVQLGVPFSTTLRDFQRRVGIPEAQYFAATVIVQRETGGALADILAQLARIMRRRAMFQGKLKAMTSESRFTAWFIGAAPLAFILWKYLTDRPFLDFFLDDPTGQSMFRFSIGMILVGAVLLRHMMRIRF
jgi:tight adherence protein B